MTACVNRKHTKKVAAVVTASLVGALSLGVAPVAAMAETGIETQSVSEQKSWANGKVTYAYDNNKMILDDLDNIEFELGDTAKYPVPAKVLPDGADNEVIVTKTDVSYFQDTNNDGECGSGDTAISSPDTYNWVTATYFMVINAPATSEYAGGQLVVPFKIVNHSLEGAKIFDKASGNISDDDFTYKKAGQNFGFVLDGQELASRNYTVDWYVTNTGDKLGGQPSDAGNYTAVLTGQGDYAGSEEQIDFVINKIDLSTADVSISDLEYLAAGNNIPTSAKVNGESFNDESLSGQLSITWVGAENDSSIIRDKTTYTVNVAPSARGEKNFTGSTQVQFSIVDTLVADSDIKFKSGSLDGASALVYVDEHGTHIDADEITCTYTDAKLDIVVTNAAGEVVPFETINTTVGTYTISVRVGAKANNYKYGSDTVTMTVKTRKGAINADASLYYTYKGTVIDHFEPVTYNGSNVLDDIKAVVKVGDTTLEQGTDYVVTVYDQDGNVVDEIVNAGVYTIVVSSDVYDISTGDPNLTIKVNPIFLSDVLLGSDDLKNFGSTSFIPYTGEAADYYFYYEDAKGNEVRLPEGIVELDHFVVTDDEGQHDTDAIVEMGKYIALIKPVDGVVNYVLQDSKAGEITVGEGNVFTDVESTYWAAENIYTAKKHGYMDGYNGTTFFGPLDNIKRGDVAVTLYKMAGMPTASWLEDYKNANGGYETGFGDVESGMYYAKAIAWAKSLGIISGDSNTGLFRPEDNISRQELAKMLCVYAEKTGKDVTVDADAVLADYDDADTVAGWAEEYVAWAVEADLMGQNSPLRADDPINRAEVATMAVRLQPEKLSDSITLLP